jgi:hypothetical protein
MLTNALPMTAFPPAVGTSTTPSINLLFRRTISLDLNEDPAESDVIPLFLRRDERRLGERRVRSRVGHMKRNG